MPRYGVFFYLEGLTGKGNWHLKFGLSHTASLARGVGTLGPSFLNAGKLSFLL